MAARGPRAFSLHSLVGSGIDILRQRSQNWRVGRTPQNKNRTTCARLCGSKKPKTI